MTNTVLVQAKVAPEIKYEAEHILNDFGLDLSTAIRMFLVKVRQTRSIPFSIGYSEKSLELTKEFASYLKNIEDDIKKDKDIFRFSNSNESINYLENLMR